ncbi:DNA-directed RNA polymerase III subunit RPC4 isoform X2 [Cynoglossus semilaevis]|uniref:DNA-directed RNA polymerase III subunit RPC4 isoform X2 n=1 Tax=Cynoglossus semilaevis TaxID=244447 RepID=UPI0007DCB511|nr:DNA-directed RNA polymerase III subunit RPC4-like isoform X2 [Cynoglossus semilaevis]
MSDSGDAPRFPSSSGLSSRAGLSFTAARGLPATVRSLSSPPPPVRLTSLRTRDLTLGGAFKKTKTFEPNVHAVRKSKPEVTENINVTSKKERKRDERRGARENRGRRREKPQTIQSHSIFEQGPADIICKTGLRGAAELRDSSTSPVYKVVKKERKRSEEDEDEILNKLQRDDFIDDPNLKNDAKLKPIQLPLCDTSRFIKKQTLSTTSGPDDHRRGGSYSRTALLPKPQQTSLADLLHELSTSDRQELFFMQLPDCVPGQLSEQKDALPLRSPTEKAAKKEGKAEDRRHLQSLLRMKSGCPVLSQMPEGFLGKLQIRKSGKVELKMGDIVMDVSEGAAFSFLQELVSVRHSEGKSGDMMVLGNVHHKLVLSPDFQSLLTQAASQQKKEP